MTLVRTYEFRSRARQRVVRPRCTRATVSAAMRLMPLGQVEGHRVLAETARRIPTIVAGVTENGEPLQVFTPALDVAAMNQQWVHSRLFRS